MRTFFKLLLIGACLGSFYLSFTFKQERHQQEIENSINSLRVTRERVADSTDKASNVMRDTLVVAIKGGKNSDIKFSDEDINSLGKLIANQFNVDSTNKVIVIQTLKQK